VYSPRIYETQIPSLYHAARSLKVPMTQLANAFIYYGLLSGNFGETALDSLPHPSKVVPEGIRPRLQLFNLQDQLLNNYVSDLSPKAAFDPYLPVEPASVQRQYFPRENREYGSS